jgi:hypothetical protein
MKRIGTAIAVGMLMIAGPAFAGQLDNLDTPYASRGACESANAGFSNEVRDSLLEQFPNFFDSEGDVQSFLTRAFPCELDPADGNWYIRDQRLAVLTSDWYQHRH